MQVPKARQTFCHRVIAPFSRAGAGKSPAREPLRSRMSSRSALPQGDQYTQLLALGDHWPVASCSTVNVAQALIVRVHDALAPEPSEAEVQHTLVFAHIETERGKLDIETAIKRVNG